MASRGLAANSRVRISPGTRIYTAFQGDAGIDHWSEHAACGGMNPADFEISRRDDPDINNKQGQSIRKHNLRKMAYAIEICEGCPVRATCLEEADEADLYWTVRGGQWPTSLRGKNVKYKKRAPMKPLLPDGDKCPQGHFGAWKTRSDQPGRYCSTCSSEAGKRFRQRQKDAAAKLAA